MFDDSATTKRLSAVIGRLRAAVSVTQADVAKAAGLDQSRVSRIEKGDVSNTADIDRVLDALAHLGSEEARAFRNFVVRDWFHIEPPSFWNPQRDVLDMAEEMLGSV